MAVYQIHHLNDKQRQQFRWMPHTSGISTARPKDYEKGAIVYAPSEYAAWLNLRESGRPLLVGDLLETEEGALRIYKYIGFEEARWFVPEAAPETP